ncbi:MAG: N-acetyl-gamma-glutamyl-phosphate reductase [Moritella sp.]|uniref:N-acetyl-gamma-glutamyl-phosphate reductase n=1 Tax=Moritella sp. TaxID=78556 RepID=UPI0025D561DE|nr:N-acetyl-gamma-glutamyl-phosphate reductase [Moritella sp.]NQZ94671.1 N-acetyl-gamma-glutamyl-phosphate reductase [Moritella sp.]
MLKTILVGATGYTGAELAHYITKHPELELAGLYVSEHSLDAGKSFSSLYGHLLGVVDQTIQPLAMSNIKHICADVDIVVLATAHEVSHDIAAEFLAQDTVVFDLSGAFRVNDPAFYENYYGFKHNFDKELKSAVYGLAEWASADIAKANLIAVPGCYPTASLSALKPLAKHGLIAADQKPIINAVSGVSGAGRKAALGSAFCEVSHAPYAVFNHRHQPEISTHLGHEVIFTPHLGCFKRGILATINVKLAAGVTPEQVTAAYQDAYQDQPMVRLLPSGWPSIKAVEKTAYCDLAWQQQGQDLIVVSAIDNLLKGAAAQAMQCINIRFGFAMTTSLV